MFATRQRGTFRPWSTSPRDGPPFDQVSPAKRLWRVFRGSLSGGGHLAGRKSLPVFPGCQLIPPSVIAWTRHTANRSLLRCPFGRNCEAGIPPRVTRRTNPVSRSSRHPGGFPTTLPLAPHPRKTSTPHAVETLELIRQANRWQMGNCASHCSSGDLDPSLRVSAAPDQRLLFGGEPPCNSLTYSVCPLGRNWPLPPRPIEVAGCPTGGPAPSKDVREGKADRKGRSAHFVARSGKTHVQLQSATLHFRSITRRKPRQECATTKSPALQRIAYNHGHEAQPHDDSDGGGHRGP